MTPAQLEHQRLQNLRRARTHQEHMCIGKLKHDDALEAMQHVISLERKSPQFLYGIYHCEYCPFLHVGRTTRDNHLTEQHEVPAA